MRLDGVRVLDLTRLLPGPYATQLLADMGADVIKIEEPTVGDYARTMNAAAGGAGGTFAAVNRGKRSVGLNLKTDEGREAFLRLAADADVVIEGFRPGVTDRLGVGYDDVRERNSEIVYCSLSGYGATGPYRDRVGHDLNYIAIAGLLDMTRPGPEAPPTIPGYPIADMAGGLFAAFSVVGGLAARGLGHGGEYIDVSMTDVVLSFSQAVAWQAFAGDHPRSGETPLTGAYPCYDVYETADGRYVTLAALEPQFWDAFCEAIGRPDLVDDHLAADPETRERVREAVSDAFGSKRRDEWESDLGDLDVMFAPVNTLPEAIENPQVRARELIDEADAGPRVGFPARPSGGLEPAGDAIPDLGEHTEDVLRAHGYDDEAIATLRERDAI